MKIILYVMLVSLLLVGCSSSEDTSALKSKISNLRSDNDSLQSQLNSCQAKLDMTGGSQSYSSNDDSSQEEPEEQESSCESVEYDVISQLGGKTIDTCESEEVKVTECGVQAGHCSSGAVYVCLKDVVIKTITKEVCN